MELLQLKYFCSVAQMESITKAAQSLHISQPSLSKTIINLEKELGTPLFDRLGRQIYLNEKGKIFYQQVHDSLNLLDNAVQQMRDIRPTARGEINLLILAASALMPCIISSFIKKHPDVRIHLHQQTSHDLCFSDAYDFSVSATPLDYTGLEVYPLLAEPLVLAVPREHPLSVYEEIQLSDASAYEFIAFSHGPSIRTLTDSLCYMAGFAPKIIFESDGTAPLFSMIESGVGISLIPVKTHAKFDENKVKLVRLTDASAKRTVNLAWRREKYLNNACMLFKQHIIEFFC